MQQESEQAPTTPAETEQAVDLDFAPADESNEDPPIVISNDSPLVLTLPSPTVVA